MENELQQLRMNSLIKKFSIFLKSNIGSILLDQQLNIFNQYSSKCIGYNLLQLSLQNKLKLIEDIQVGHYIDMAFSSDGACFYGDIQTDYQNFPIATDCIDNLILHHILDFSNNPFQVLRESDRVLSDGGNIMIMSFNPISLLPIFYFSSRFFKYSFPKPNFVRMGRVIDWLTILNYEVLEKNMFFYQLPINYNWIQKKSLWFESFGKSMKIPFGLCYFLIAKKRSFPMNPINKTWSNVVKSAKQAGVNAQQKNT